MATEFDLAEQAGVSIDAVRGWLKRRGYGGGRNQKISQSIEREFLDAAAQAAPALAAEHRSAPRQPAAPQRAPARSRPQPRAPAQPDPRLRASALEIAELRRQLGAAQAGLEAAEARLAEVDDAAPPAPEARPEAPQLEHVRSILARQGLAGRHAHDAMLVALAQQPERVLTALMTTDASAFERVQPICLAVVCRQVAAFDGAHPVNVDAQRCAVCRGRDSRRWFMLMAARLKRAGRARVLVVGGGPDQHANLRSLLRDALHLDVRIVDGERSPDTKRAKALVMGTDVVVFWASTILSHAVSNSVKAAALGAPDMVVAVTPTGGKGVAALCRAVVEALDAHAPVGRRSKQDG